MDKVLVILVRAEAGHPLTEKQQEDTVRARFLDLGIDATKACVFLVPADEEIRACGCIKKWIENGKIEILGFTEASRLSNNRTTRDEMLRLAKLGQCRIVECEVLAC